MEIFIPPEEGLTIFVSCWGKGFYNRKCQAISYMTRDPSSLYSDELMTSLRCSQSVCSMKIWRLFTLPDFSSFLGQVGEKIWGTGEKGDVILGFFVAKTACWEFQLISPTAPIPEELSAYQMSSNNSLMAMHSQQRATERYIDSLQPYYPWQLLTMLPDPIQSCNPSKTQHLQLWMPSSQQCYHPGTLQRSLLCPLLPTSGHPEN